MCNTVTFEFDEMVSKEYKIDETGDILWRECSIHLPKLTVEIINKKYYVTPYIFWPHASTCCFNNMQSLCIDPDKTAINAIICHNNILYAKEIIRSYLEVFNFETGYWDILEDWDDNILTQEDFFMCPIHSKVRLKKYAYVMQCGTRISHKAYNLYIKKYDKELHVMKDFKSCYYCGKWYHVSSKYCTYCGK